MKKNIDIPNDVRWALEVMALDEKKDLKTFIQDVLIKLATTKYCSCVKHRRSFNNDNICEKCNKIIKSI